MIVYVYPSFFSVNSLEPQKESTDRLQIIGHWLTAALAIEVVNMTWMTRDFKLKHSAED